MDKECFIIWSDDPARMEDLEEYKKYLAEECPELLEKARTIVVFDHHRQSEEVIKNTDLLILSRMPHPPVR